MNTCPLASHTDSEVRVAQHVVLEFLGDISEAAKTLCSTKCFSGIAESLAQPKENHRAVKASGKVPPLTQSVSVNRVYPAPILTVVRTFLTSSAAGLMRLNRAMKRLAATHVGRCCGSLKLSTSASGKPVAECRLKKEVRPVLFCARLFALK